MRYSFLYRGPLSSCNYACSYCPFGKEKSSAAELEDDASKLRRFARWIEGRENDKLSMLFTPWGEALIRRYYRETLIALSHLPQVERVAIQTNLCCDVEALREADRDALALWCTFHPDQTSYESFHRRCLSLSALGIRHSVGIVGLNEHVEVAERLRRALPADTYLWINAYKSEGPDYYEPTVVESFSAIDPLFALNNRRHLSRGQACLTGESVFSVDGEGDVRRCHFVSDVLGNLYRDSIESLVGRRPCPNERCGCYIGYVHLERLGLEQVYGGGILERIPLASTA